MEELYKLASYFPYSFSDSTLKKYFEHHYKACYKCAENNLYSSAYSHLHILYMTFVYVQLLRISKEKSREFKLCWIGFPQQEKDFLRDTESVFSFSKIQEKSVFRFFRIIGFDDGVIGDISSLVNKRNNHLHANGRLFFENVGDFENEIEQYYKKIETIISKQKDFLKELYNIIIGGFETDFEITEDVIKADFAEQYYFSKYELKLLKDKDDIVSQFIKDNWEEI